MHENYEKNESPASLASENIGKYYFCAELSGSSSVLQQSDENIQINFFVNSSQVFVS